jgi:cell division protein FtsW (lipid II flippase)
MIKSLLTIYVVFFMIYSIYIFWGIRGKDNLLKLYNKISLGIVVLFITFAITLGAMYQWLQSNNYSFQTTYSADINSNNRTVIVGTSRECDIQLYNRFSDSEHVVFDFTDKPTVEIISGRRSAIVNNRLISLKKLKDKNITKEINIHNGDIIRLGYSDYKIAFDKSKLTLKSLFFTPSFVNIFNIYSTTTLPNITNESNKGTSSVWWVYLLTVVVSFFVTFSILKALRLISKKFTFIGERRYIIYPILYFSFFLAFLLFASLINFTVLQFFQFSVYNKGALYTVLLVYIIMLFIFFIARLGYKRDKSSTLAALLFIALISILPLYYSDYIYSSNFIADFNKTALLTSAEWFFIFTIFGLLFGRLIGVLISKQSLFSLESVKSDFILKWVLISLVAALIGFGFSFVFKEGAGIVLVETVKLFIFFLFSVFLLDDFNKRGYKVSYSFWIVVPLIFLLMAIVFGLKDMGSLIQVVLAVTIIALFFYHRLKEINLVNKRVVITIVLLVIVGAFVASVYLSDNIRYDMWKAPFEQNLKVNNRFYIYYFDQIARGLLLIKQATLLPNSFIEHNYIVLPNLHTDFIFALFLNVFGTLGFFAILTAFLITIFSFDKSIELYQSSKKDIYRFIYGINVIFVAYFFSYIIINILSVLQIFPLTDVPFPILTYARGVLILFFILYIFVVVVNYLYLSSVNRSNKKKI